jgi:hypothetical protein
MGSDWLVKSSGSVAPAVNGTVGPSPPQKKMFYRFVYCTVGGNWPPKRRCTLLRGSAQYWRYVFRNYGTLTRAPRKPGRIIWSLFFRNLRKDNKTVTSRTPPPPPGILLILSLGNLRINDHPPDAVEVLPGRRRSFWYVYDSSTPRNYLEWRWSPELFIWPHQ